MPGNVLSPTLKDRYLEQLEKDEVAIGEAAAEFETAKAALEMGLRRYIALRDFVTEQIGNSPYSFGIEWPDSLWSDERGHYRFTGMKIGDAVVQVLKDALDRSEFFDDKNDRWLTLDKVIDALTNGGLGFPEPIQARAINAAIQALRKSQVVMAAARRTDSATVYRYNPDAAERDEAALDSTSGTEEESN